MAYTRLLRAYYRNEKPLPNDIDAVCRIARARSKDERAAVQTVLEEFFTLFPNGWRNKRADVEIEKFQAKSAKAKSSANARWEEEKSNALAMRSHSDGNALAMLTANRQPPTANREPKTPPNPLKGGVCEEQVFPEVLQTDEFKKAWAEWNAHRKEIKHPLKPTQAAKQIKKFAEWGVARSIRAIDYTIEKGWQGIREPEGALASAPQKKSRVNSPEELARITVADIQGTARE